MSVERPPSAAGTLVSRFPPSTKAVSAVRPPSTGGTPPVKPCHPLKINGYHPPRIRAAPPPADGDPLPQRHGLALLVPQRAQLGSLSPPDPKRSLVT